MKTIFALIILGLALSSCGKEQDVDKIGDAQLCIDKLGSSATSSEVDDCLGKIDGISSLAANNLRCAGGFLKEGFLSATKLTTAMKALEDSGTNSFIGLVTFTSGSSISANVSNAASTFDYCLKAENKGATLISSFGYVGMALYNFLNTTDDASCSDTPGATGYDFTGCVDTFTSPTNLNAIPNAMALAQLGDENTANASAVALQNGIGSVVISTVTLSCGTASANADLCKSMTDAVTSAGGTSNPRKVAKYFLQGLVQ
jgi:hypothetical protein